MNINSVSGSQAASFVQDISQPKRKPSIETDGGSAGGVDSVQKLGQTIEADGGHDGGADAGKNVQQGGEADGGHDGGADARHIAYWA